MAINESAQIVNSILIVTACVFLRVIAVDRFLGGHV